jgi:hypothetical protein
MALCKRGLTCCTILEHYRNTIFDRIVAATAIAMQPGVRGAVWPGSERRMAYGADKDLEQGLGNEEALHI